MVGHPLIQTHSQPLFTERRKRVEARLEARSEEKDARRNARSERQSNRAKAFGSIAKKFQENAAERQKARSLLIGKVVDTGGGILKSGMLIPIVAIGGLAAFLIMNPGVAEKVVSRIPMM